MAVTADPIPPPFFSPYLDDQLSKLAAKQIPWEGYQRAKLLSQEECSLLRSLEKLPLEQRGTVFATQGATYAKLYIDLLRKLQRVDTVQAVLVSISNMLVDVSTIAYFHALSTEGESADPYAPIVKCLAMDTDEEFVHLESLRILALLIATDPKDFPPHLMGTLLASLSTLLNGSRAQPRDIAAQVLNAILGKKQFRQAVWQEGEAISGLVKALKGNTAPQQQYSAISCLWQLSFEQVVAEGLDKKYDAVALLTNIAKSAVKEKVIRVVIATFRNLVTLAPSANLPSMFMVKLLPFVVSLQDRKWSDEDVVEDLDFLRDELKARLDGLTTYDEYVSELESGHLVWSPAHDSEDFWKENGVRIGSEADGKVVRRLVELLKSNSSPTVLAVAAHDVGQFVKYGGDKSKKIIADLDGKTRVMELMTYDNPDVRYQSLIAVQRLMSQHVA
ncbi:H(+)-transporting V1 sector ATPase subunit H [Cryptotrichosporon argae]